MIDINFSKANIDDILVAENFQKPNVAIEEYWQGSKEDLYLYYKKHNINYNFTFENLEQLHQGAEAYLLNLSNAVKKDIAQFDFRLRSALIPRNIDLSKDDYCKIEFDTSEESNSQILNNFLNATTRSFLDYRSYEDNKLTLIYNRKGIFDEGSRIAIVKSRDNVTLKDNFQTAKENNFVLSGLLKELVKNADYDFRYTYMAGASGERERIITSQEIKKDTSIVKERHEQAIKTLEIKEKAQEEIKKEEMVNRQSLNPDSNKDLILKEATTEIRLETKDLSKVTTIEDSKIVIDNIAQSTLDDYAQKEIEKLKIRLAKATDDAKVVYAELKQKINQDGMSVQEALNYAKQKYREEHTVNLASMYLSKDLLQVSSLEKIINDKEKEILNLENIITEKENSITTRENTISSLKSTLQTKENEFRLSVEKHQGDLEFLKVQYEKSIDEITEKSEEKIQEMEKELNGNEELIIRLTEQLNISKDNGLKLEQANEELQELKSKIEVQNREFQLKEEELLKIQQQNEELQRNLREKELYIEEKLKIFEITNDKVLEFLNKTGIIQDINDGETEDLLKFSDTKKSQNEKNSPDDTTKIKTENSNVEKPKSPAYGNYGNFQENEVDKEEVSIKNTARNKNR